MDKFVIEGGYPLRGTVRVSRAKNAALPIMAAALLAEGKTVIRNCPHLSDVEAMAVLLRSLGATVKRTNGDLIISVGKTVNPFADYEIVRKMRASFCVLGPLVGRLHHAKVSLPGGCVIGPRPVDLHLKGLNALGCHTEIDAGYVIADGPKMRGDVIYLGGPFGSTVLGTANVMMAATLIPGTTIIEDAAAEPEVLNLVEALTKMGARVRYVANKRLEIKGVKRLHGATVDLIPDRIEAGTYMMAAAATAGDVTVEGLCMDHLHAVVDRLRAMGVRIQPKGDGACRVVSDGRFKPSDVVTLPYPGFPTDLQAQVLTLLTAADGLSVVTENIYPDRFMHVAELSRMGVEIRKEGPHAIISGRPKMSGAPVMASDLRASAALVIAGLMALGTTTVNRIYHIDRGYEHIEEKLRPLGAHIRRVSDGKPNPTPGAE